MTNWTPVRRIGRVDPVPHGDQWAVDLQLNVSTTDTWRAHYAAEAAAYPLSGSSPPHANGTTDAVYVIFDESDLEAVVEQVDARLHSANELHERETLPYENAEQQRAGAEAVRRDRVRADLAARAAKLEAPETSQH